MTGCWLGGGRSLKRLELARSLSHLRPTRGRGLEKDLARRRVSRLTGRRGGHRHLRAAPTGGREPPDLLGRRRELNVSGRGGPGRLSDRHDWLCAT